LLAQGIENSIYDHPLRAANWMARQTASDVSTTGHANGRDEFFEFHMKEFKGMCRTYGERRVMQMAQVAGWPTWLRRKFDSAADTSNNRSVRAKKHAPQYQHMYSVAMMFLRMGVCDQSTRNNIWSLENRTGHNVTHRQSAIGGAMKRYEGKLLKLSTSDLVELNINANAGTFRCIRAQAIATGGTGTGTGANAAVSNTVLLLEKVVP